MESVPVMEKGKRLSLKSKEEKYHEVASSANSDRQSRRISQISGADFESQQATAQKKQPIKPISGFSDESQQDKGNMTQFLPN